MALSFHLLFQDFGYGYIGMNESQNSIVPTVTPINSEPNAAPNDSPGVIVFPPALWLATLILGLVVHYFLWPFHIFHSVPAWLARTVGVLTIVGGGSLAMGAATPWCAAALT